MNRMMRTALLSLICNVSYALLHGAAGVLTQSWWFATLSAYYIVLSVMRFSLLLIRRKEAKQGTSEDFAARLTGGLFLAMAQCLAGTVILCTMKDRARPLHVIVIITMALYVFIKLTLAIIHLIRCGKQAPAVYRSLRNIALAEAFVALFSLQRSMLVSFPGMTESGIRLMNILTGTAVCLLIFLLGLNLIGGKHITMAKSKLVKANEKIAETVVKGYKKVEDTVVGGYKKVEETVVGAYTKVEDKFVDKYLTREGETVEEAKARLKKDNK